jgi:hypothetical protein
MFDRAESFAPRDLDIGDGNVVLLVDRSHAKAA